MEGGALTPPVILFAIRRDLAALSHKHASVAGLWQKFGASIREDRKRRKIPLKKFAGGLDISSTYCSYLESGKREWSVERAELAVKLLTRREQWPN